MKSPLLTPEQGAILARCLRIMERRLRGSAIQSHHYREDSTMTIMDKATMHTENMETTTQTEHAASMGEGCEIFGVGRSMSSVMTAGL